ncbi:hypothetical protein HWV62_43539 [Athelia sp. TMB]|nr:hypothetical protein HWV62_43539 [Athelia sp. TMB]
MEQTEVQLKDAIVIYLLTRRTPVNRPIALLANNLPTAYHTGGASAELIEAVHYGLTLATDVINITPRVAEIIAAKSEIYERNLHISNIMAVTYSPVVFIWTELKPEERTHRSARYAVHFHGQSNPPFSAMVAAYVILKFPSKWRSRTRVDFNLVQLAMALDDRGVWGAMIFGEDFAAAYGEATSLAANNPDKNKTPDLGMPMTTLPEDKKNLHLRNVHLISEVITTGRFVLRHKRN